MYYDVIGDIHGYATLLKKMLLKLGYQKDNGGYFHPQRKAVFVGDFINRGPEIRKTLKIIRKMEENGNALVVLGNHEINAIIFHLKDKKGNPLVKNPRKNYLALFKSLKEFLPYPEEWNSHLKWMRKLPFFLELGNIRVVHACWSEEAVKVVSRELDSGRSRKSIFREYYKKPESELSRSITTLTRGIDFCFPGDLRLVNNKGVVPRTFRLCWWEDAKGKSFREMSFESKYDLPDYTIPDELVPETFYYSENEPVLFFGHYCRGKGPQIIKSNICCVDSCVSGTKSLTAYQCNGENELFANNLAVVRLKD